MRKYWIIATLAVLVALLATSSGTVSAREAASPSGSLGRELAEAVNRYRASLGLSPLAWDDRLYNAAVSHNDLMAQQNGFSHILPGEPDPMTRIKNAGVNPLYNMGENIAGGYFDAEKTRVQWTNSPGHDAIMRGDYNAIGCELKQYPGTTYGSLATCDFAKTTTVPAPAPAPAPAPGVPPRPQMVAGRIYRFEFYMPAAKDGIVQKTEEICRSYDKGSDGRFEGQVGVGCYFYGTTADNEPPTTKAGWAYVEFRDFTPYYRSMKDTMLSLMPSDPNLYRYVETPIP